MKNNQSLKKHDLKSILLEKKIQLKNKKRKIKQEIENDDIINFHSLNNFHKNNNWRLKVQIDD